MMNDDYQNVDCPYKEAQKLYRIGLFSQMNRVTVKTLRYYDEAELLKPEYVDEVNGYRYYTSSQLPQLHQILALRDMNFSIEEIQQIMLGASEERLLLKKKSELLRIMAQTSEKLASIESYLSHDYLDSDYRIIIKSIPETTIASMYVHLASYGDLFHKMPEMGLEMERAGCECPEPGYCFTIYMDSEYKANDVDAEICEAVKEKKKDGETLKFKTLPRVDMAACVLHKGPYEELLKAYSAIVRFIEENGYEIIDLPRESYIDGIWNKDQPSDWLTEIQFPVRKIETILDTKL